MRRRTVVLATAGVRRVLTEALLAAGLVLAVLGVVVPAAGQWGVPLRTPPVDVVFVDLDKDGNPDGIAVLTDVASLAARKAVQEWLDAQPADRRQQLPTDMGSVVLLRYEVDGSLWRHSETLLFRQEVVALRGLCGSVYCVQRESLVGREPLQFLGWGYRWGDYDRLLVMSNRFGGIFDLGGARATTVQFAQDGGSYVSEVSLVNYERFRRTRDLRDLILVEGDPHMAVLDANRDGCTDLAITTIDDQAVRVWYGDCKGNVDLAWLSRIGGRGDEPRFVGAAELSTYKGYPPAAAVVAKGGILSGEIQIIALTGDGRFILGPEISALPQPRAAVWGDFDNDGMPDLVVAGVNGLVFLRGNGTSADGVPKFSGKQPIGDLAWPANLLFSARLITADLNRDGQLDLAVANYGAGTVDIWIGAGDGTFARDQQLRFGIDARPVSLAVGDVNRDGWPDLIVVSRGTDEISVALNLAQAGFVVLEQPGRVPGRVFALGDVIGTGVSELRAQLVASTHVELLTTPEARVDYPNEPGFVPVPVIRGAATVFAAITKEARDLGHAEGFVVRPPAAGRPQLVTYENLSSAERTGLATAIEAGTISEKQARRLNMIGTGTGDLPATVPELIGSKVGVFSWAEATPGFDVWCSSSVPITLLPGDTSLTNDDPRSYLTRLRVGDLDGDGIMEIVAIDLGRHVRASPSIVALKTFVVGPNRNFWTWPEEAWVDRQVLVPYVLKTYPSTSFPADVVVADFVPSSAGHDVAVINRGPNTVEILKVEYNTDRLASGAVTGDFLKATAVGWGRIGGGMPVVAAAGDLNGNGRLDLVIAAEAELGPDPFCILFRNATPPDGPTTLLFENPVILSDPRADGIVELEVRDLTGDGSPEVIALGQRSRNAVVFSVIPVPVTPATPQGWKLDVVAECAVVDVPYSMALGDLNGDGVIDLVIAHRRGLTVFLGDGTGRFPSSFMISGDDERLGGVPYWVGIADVASAEGGGTEGGDAGGGARAHRALDLLVAVGVSAGVPLPLSDETPLNVKVIPGREVSP